jgi:glyoxylase-like metal-dependent hydrolase (beta-lactamase superfamily II)
MPAFICQTCGVQLAPATVPPERCPICADERQYVGREGQQWTTLAEMQGNFRSQLVELEPRLWQVTTEPNFGIGQRALLLATPQGNLLWDCLSFIDSETQDEVRDRGGLAAIAISHPHFYGSCVEWSQAFGGVPIYLSARDREFLPRPDSTVIHFEGDEIEPLHGLRVLRLGGHFRGSTVLHWPAGASGRGALLTGDTIAVAADRRWAAFLYSYPNRIPLPAGDVAAIGRRISEITFDRVYGAWPGDDIGADAKAAVLRSVERYLGMLDGTWARG